MAIFNAIVQQHLLLRELRHSKIKIQKAMPIFKPQFAGKKQARGH